MPDQRTEGFEALLDVNKLSTLVKRELGKFHL
jgi:hypothetical protein